MPSKPKKPCKHPNCPNLTFDIYCDNHKGLYVRESSSKRGYDSKWRTTRKLFLNQHPLCEACKSKNKFVKASEVHHIIPIRDGGSNTFDNLMALCKSCHSKHTAVDGGFGRNIVYKY